MKQYFVPVILMLVMHATCGAISFNMPGSGRRYVARPEAEPAGVEVTMVPSHRLPKDCPADIAESCPLKDIHFRADRTNLDEMRFALQWRVPFLGQIHCDWSGWEHARAALPLLRHQPVVTLSLARAEVSPQGLIALKDATQLKGLSLEGCWMSDDACRSLCRIDGLESLELVGTGITDEGLVEVAKLSELQSLDLRGTRITDQGLASLTSLMKLKVLDLRGTNSTHAGICRIFNTRKNLRVIHDSKSTDVAGNP